MIGRERELAELQGLLSAAKDGTTAAVVLRGEAGIGKSTLIAELERRAADAGFQTLVCTGVQSEASIGMAGLHQLLHAAVDRAGALPPQQRDALLSVFGLGPDVQPDRLVLSVAVLSLLEDLADERPLLLVLEDVQWMDEPTQSMAGFVVRRLRDVPVLIVASCRDELPGPIEALRLPELVLGRLPDADAARLLAGASPALGAETRALVLGQAEGNPLALVELARGLAERPPNEVIGAQSMLPLPDRLERVFAAQVAELPAPSRELLLIAAANTEPWLTELAAAAERMGLGLDALAPAEQAGLVRADGPELRFRHPLVRSAIYATAPRPRQIAVHEAIAAVLAEDGDQHRAAWHRAAAATGGDETVAGDLERAATALTARGDTGAAMRSWIRAAELSESTPSRVRRLAFAAETARRTGLNAATLRLTAEVIRTSEDPLDVARAALTEETIGCVTGVITRDPLQVASIARRAAAAPTLPPPARFLPVALMLITASYCAAYGVGPDVRQRMVEDLLAMSDSGEVGLTAAGLALLDPVEHGQESLETLRDIPPIRRPLEAVTLGLGAEPAHDWELSSRYFRMAVDGARAEHAAGDLANAAVMLGRSLAARGLLTEALAAAEEGSRISEDLGDDLLSALGATVVAHVHAWRGDDEKMAEALARSRELGSPTRVDVTVWQRWSVGLAELAAGRQWNAYIELRAVLDLPHLGLIAIADLVEAAARAGYPQQAAERLRQAREYAASFDSPLMRMLLLRSDALLAEDAEPAFRAALAVPGADAYPLQVARTRLAYGEWLRRQRRINEARAELTAAAGVFRAAGARPWLVRAESETRASGGAVPEIGEAHRSVLTAQELQIARLAAEGRTNKEIADHLYLSHRTVGAHLYRIYPKLGVTGRGALREAIAGLA